MNDASLLTTLFFLHATIGLGISAAWFIKKKSERLQSVGFGLAGYGLGMALWTVLVLVQPDNIKTLVVAGSLPFLLGSMSIANAASAKKGGPIVRVTALLAIATFISACVYSSKPYFSDEGVLHFEAETIPTILYLVTLSVGLLPAIKKLKTIIETTAAKTPIIAGLALFYMTAAVAVLTNNDTLLKLDGLAMSLALLALWSTVVRFWSKKA